MIMEALGEMKKYKANVINIEALMEKSMMNLKAFQMKSLCINSYKVLKKTMK